METPIYKFALRDDLRNNREFLPTRAEPQATGWDVRVALTNKSHMIIKPGEYVKIPLGFRAFCPEGWWLQLNPRSSSFVKKNLHALYGVIDECYPNELVFAAQLISDSHNVLQERGLTLQHGEAIGQLIPVRRQEMLVEEISNEEFENLCKTRNAIRQGGIGSTG